MQKEKLTVEDVKAILKAMEAWIDQKPDLDPANYNMAEGQNPKSPDFAAFDAEYRKIQAQGRRARGALKVANQYLPNPDAMERALTRFSGRLSWNGETLEYTTGQYWPTEYRLAAAVVLEDYNETCRPKSAPAPGFDPMSVTEIQAAAKARGSHFFDRETMRFFRSRILPEIYKGSGGVYFVTSEQGPNGLRRFTIRKFDPVTADIEAFGPFYKLTRERAQRLARIAAENPEAAKEALEA
jgi:hypothetical protein